MYNRKSSRFKASEFFDPDFPFFIKHFTHPAKMYNEKTLHQREFWKIIYVESGRGEKIINGSHYLLNPGSLFLIHPNDITSFLIKTQSVKVCNIGFLPEFLGENLRQLTNEYQFFAIFNQEFHSTAQQIETLYILECDKKIKSIITNMLQEFKGTFANRGIMLRSMLIELLIRLGRKGGQNVKSNSRKQIVAYIDHVITQKYKEGVELDLLAVELSMDKGNLCRLYKKKTGATIIQQLLKQRLNHSCQILLDPQQSISDACYESGFQDLSYFYRVFKTHFGMTPKEYRQNMRVGVAALNA